MIVEKHMKTYEDYCADISSKDKVRQAELMYYARSWFYKIIKPASGDDYMALDDIRQVEFKESGDDLFSVIIRKVYEAFGYISQNLREQIVRELDLVPIYKAREINSAGMNWISRRPGLTVREKLSGTNSVLAVNKRMSFNTGENRLLVAFLKKVHELLELRESSLPPEFISDEERNFLVRVTLFLRSDPVQEIARWDNLPPNNALLSDRHYSKIWAAWNELSELDDMIKRDSENLTGMLCTVLFWNVYLRAAKSFAFAQMPVLIDSKKFLLYPPKDMSGTDSTLGSRLTLSAVEFKNGAYSFTVTSATMKRTVVVRGMTVEIGAKGEVKTKISITVDSMSKIASKIMQGINAQMPSSAIQSKRIMAQDMLIDLFSAHPWYIADGGSPERLKARLAAIDYTIGDMTYPLDMDKACALDAANTSKVISAFSCKSAADDVRRLFSVVSKNIKAHSFKFLFPDIYSELDLIPYRRTARYYYHNVDTLPRSIGAAFSFEQDKMFGIFKDGDILLVVDIAGNGLTLTPLVGKPDENLNCPERQNIIWERYPSVSIPLDKSLEQYHNSDHEKNMFGIFGADLPEYSGDTMYVLNENDGFDIFHDIASGRLLRLDINSKVDDYIKSHDALINGANVFVLTLSPLLSCGGRADCVAMTHKMCIEGGRINAELTEQLGVSLWRDHLPDLSIRLKGGVNFDLVKDKTIVPVANEVIEILIPNTFTLPANRPDYHFDLVQGNSEKTSQHQAVVKHPVFPIDHDVECKLNMTYHYGAEEPFTLTFIPCDKKSAGFSSINVEWIDRSEDGYEYMGLIYPEFPPVVPVETLCKYPQKSKDSIKEDYTDLFLQLSKALSGFFPQYYIEADELSWNRAHNTAFFNMTYEGNYVKVAAFENCFLDGIEDDDDDDEYDDDDDEYDEDDEYDDDEDEYDDYDNEETRYYFDVGPGKPDEYGNKRYKATRIVNSLSLKSLQKRLNMNGVLFYLHTIFSGRSFYDSDIPREYVSDIPKYLEGIWELYKDQGYDAKQHPRIFSMFAMLHEIMPDEYYDHLISRVEKYLKKKGKLDENIGYAIGDCKTENETKLFYNVLEIGKTKVRKTSAILARCAWKYPGFILNANPNALLGVFEETIDYLCSVLDITGPEVVLGKTNDKCHEPDIVKCFEYLLAVFRLREKEEESISMRLSCNSDHICKLINILEHIFKGAEPNLKKFLNKSRIQFETGSSDTNPLIRALLVYAYGESGDDEIRISGVNQ